MQKESRALRHHPSLVQIKLHLFPMSIQSSQYLKIRRMNPPASENQYQRSPSSMISPQLRPRSLARLTQPNPLILLKNRNQAGSLSSLLLKLTHLSSIKAKWAISPDNLLPPASWAAGQACPAAAQSNKHLSVATRSFKPNSKIFKTWSHPSINGNSSIWNLNPHSHSRSKQLLTKSTIVSYRSLTWKSNFTTSNEPCSSPSSSPS